MISSAGCNKEVLRQAQSVIYVLKGRGRPRETWRRCMEREMKDVGMTWVAISKKAQDRDVWRMFACGLYPDRGERQ